MIIFFVSDISPTNCFLEEDEFQHCIKVLRHKENDVIHITNGQGFFAKARIQKIKKRIAELVVISQEELHDYDSKVFLCVSPPKNRSRWELLLEKSVEIGVNTIVPMTSGNSERVKFNIERSQKIMRSAALQSKRIIHPNIEEITTFDKIISNKKYKEFNKFIAHYGDGNLHLKNINLKASSSIVLIGPEGDFRKEEITKALDQNFKLVNISNNRLRTETAALVAVNFLV